MESRAPGKALWLPPPRRVAIPRGEIACPVAALRAWLDAAGITEGAIFRRIFNKRAQRVTERRLKMLETYSRDAEAFVGHAGAGLL
jgi:hypothetical protein